MLDRGADVYNSPSHIRLEARIAPIAERGVCSARGQDYRLLCCCAGPGSIIVVAILDCAALGKSQPNTADVGCNDHKFDLTLAFSGTQHLTFSIDRCADYDWRMHQRIRRHTTRIPD